MPVHSWETADLRPESAYNVQAHRLVPFPGGVEPYEGGAWVILAAGDTMTEHVNPDDESELFYVVEGSGWLSIAGEEDRRVKFGDTILIPPRQAHSLVNDSGQRLVFLSLWWGGQR